ncbi:phosphohistidine phosphatase SixA [Algibacillus agarilyticus]|uniref:phosphohistidine phosphatase SixA n=1 Tax=Algibacillus agarilyticus TaxID=2234133 RepID=UPI000DD07F52|nr:phosphohistidine phosphatase SixA [Algibacillus agarilyticus]
MQLVIVRHGEAGPYKLDDETRELTPNGVDEVSTVSKWLLEQHFGHFDVALVSPFIRAQQTWATMLNAKVGANVVHSLSELTPDAAPDIAEAIIRAYADGAKTVVVVSHLPLVSFLVECFTTDYGPIFSTGGCSVIELADWDSKGDVIAFTSPAQIYHAAQAS